MMLSPNRWWKGLSALLHMFSPPLWRYSWKCHCTSCCDPSTDDTNGLRADKSWTVFILDNQEQKVSRTRPQQYLWTQRILGCDDTSFLLEGCKEKNIRPDFKSEIETCSLKCIYHINHTIIQNDRLQLNPQVKTSILLRYQKQQQPVNTSSTCKFPVRFRTHRKSFTFSSFQNKSAAVTLIWRVKRKYVRIQFTTTANVK